MMYLYVIGGAGVLALVLVRLAVRTLRQRKLKAAQVLAEKRASDVCKWAEGILAHGNDLDAIVESDPMPHISYLNECLVSGYGWRLSGEAQMLADKAIGYREASLEAEAAVAEARRLLGRESRELALYGLLVYLTRSSRYLSTYLEQTLNVSPEDLREELRGLVNSQLDELANAARLGDSEAFDKLMGFYKTCSSPVSIRDYGKVGLKFDLSSDWDELVAHFYESPAVHHFADLETNMPTGYWRQRAAEVLRSRGKLSDALKVLAVADCRAHGGYVWREEIGDRLLSDLAKYVRRLRARQTTHIN